jgi:HEAT repeat protein
MRAEHLRLTHALLRPETTLAAAEALRGSLDTAAVEGLIELVYAPRTAKEATTALAVLDGCDHPLVLDALSAALDSPHATVRLAAVESLHRRGAHHTGDSLQRILRRDESWPVRRAALEALADAPDRWHVLAAADDPHWRVRHALLGVLLGWCTDEARRREIDERLAALPDGARVRGLREYLRYRWTGAPAETFPEPDEPARRCPFWDWDAAVLARKIERMGAAGRRAALDVMPFLLGHADERVRTLAADALRSWGEPRHLAEALAHLGDPRTGACESVTKLFASFDLDRTEKVARFVLHLPAPTPAQLAWAIDQAGPAFPPEEEREALLRLTTDAGSQPAAVREALARLARRWQEQGARAEEEEPRPENLSPEEARHHPHPHVRAAALTPERAAELMADLTRETSWHVLARAARLAKVPLWQLEPAEPWQPAPVVPPAVVPLHPIPAAPSHARPLGRGGPLVSVVGISGHYGLPVEGFVRAFEAGVNLMFWEPNYRTMTEFCTRLSPANRGTIHLVAGTFEADGERVRRDAERALRALKAERLGLFLIFWVQSWDRVTPDVRAALERLKAEGKVAAYGLSTHSRPLAVEAMEAGWNPVMVRHSAAHRGAEERVFPHAAELGTSLITFNNTCYGRLLEPRDGHPAPDAADCYRFSLSQPAVRCCFSAPATPDQLDEDLAALRDPSLADDRRRRLEEHGASLYREETTFRRLVRAL